MNSYFECFKKTLTQEQILNFIDNLFIDYGNNHLIFSFCLFEKLGHVCIHGLNSIIVYVFKCVCVCVCFHVFKC
jgi:hypothetical protein